MITVVLTTFGRSQELLEEAVQSFLLQSYPDKKLLIVNIHPTPVIFDHPEVEIHNIEPFEYYGQQAHYALSQIDTPLWSVLDSDDIILLWHLKNLHKNYKALRMLGPIQVGHKKMLVSSGNELLEPRNPNWTCYLYDALDKDMLATIKVGSQCTYIDQFIYKCDFFKLHGWFDDSLPGYIWRNGLGWQTTRDLKPNITCKELVKEMPGYSGRLKPHWRMNYSNLSPGCGVGLLAP